MVKVPVLRIGKVAAPTGADHALAGSAFPAKNAIADVNPPASPWIDKSVAAQRTEKAGLAAPRSEVTLDFVPPVTRRTPRITFPRRGRSDWTHSLTNSLRMSDTALVAAAVFAGFALNTNGLSLAAESPAFTHHLMTGLILGLVWLGALEVYRTRDPKVLGVGPEEYKRVLSASFRVFGFLGIVAVVFRLDAVSSFVLVSLPLGLVALTGSRWSFRRWLSHEKSRGRCLSRAIVVGEPQDVRYVIKQINRKSGAAYDILGACLPGARRGAVLKVDHLRVPVLSSIYGIAHTVRQTGANAVIVAGPVPGGNQFIQELGWQLEENAAELVLAATLTNVAGPRIHWRPVEGLPLMHVDIPHYSGGKHTLKRLMDITVSASALLILSPILLLLAAIVHHDSPGPVLFRQERVGRRGTTFHMLKFRSMVVDAESRLEELNTRDEGAGVLFKIRGDPRITRCGRWMRKYSLDELPQFWNVLVGNMSLVGPRPPLAREVSGYERHTHRRLLIKPGITGLWQINGRSDLPWDEAVRLDLYYVENWSIAGDLIIMWRTFRAMIQPSGAY
ncbi:MULTISPECIES: sugar transferase [Micrococcaceae]|jgi:exopolysaccharide biosynthesis polyprenyl glycosylphosphotransferase|uniref:Glucosyltransferase n=1 Tax=Paenarthrobacter aurescens (strain TC1) TaxID=290340 RepID=A1R6M9_PAEAT|nr:MULTISPECIES: sugar transferase [Micrococcaceae]ABM07882.1 putative glucosyltransferase [Paenarthrobacter aurescens TC1]AFR29205.1 putative glycosyl transferase [Arthrobacter sp. Rue61a]MBP2265736.1 exopolysaccharide biosynthesis polyprenyl glycosylphosphotransferase [Pseudarthrobacter sp. PvP004]